MTSVVKPLSPGEVEYVDDSRGTSRASTMTAKDLPDY